MNGYTVLNWDLSLIIVPIAVLLLAVLPTLGTLLRWRHFNYVRAATYDDGAGWAVIFYTMAVITTVCVAGMLLALIPYQSRYWKWYKVPAHIEAVSNTLRDASGDLTTTPIVTVEGLAQPVSVDDPRIVTMTGRDIVLTCQPVWHYRAADTITCRIYTYQGATS